MRFLTLFYNTEQFIPCKSTGEYPWPPVP
jgi:hypothetical protein